MIRDYRILAQLAPEAGGQMPLLSLVEQDFRRLARRLYGSINDWQLMPPYLVIKMSFYQESTTVERAVKRLLPRGTKWRLRFGNREVHSGWTAAEEEQWRRMFQLRVS